MKREMGILLGLVLAAVMVACGGGGGGGGDPGAGSDKGPGDTVGPGDAADVPGEQAVPDNPTPTENVSTGEMTDPGTTETAGEENPAVDNPTPTSCYYAVDCSLDAGSPPEATCGSEACAARCILPSTVAGAYCSKPCSGPSECGDPFPCCGNDNGHLPENMCLPMVDGGC